MPVCEAVHRPVCSRGLTSPPPPPRALCPLELLAFSPVVAPSVIREAVIRILCPITTRQERNRDAGRLKPSGSCPRDRGEMPRYFGDEIDVPVDTVAVEGSRDGLGTDISVCTFWCAVAMGGLVEGRPAKLVSVGRGT